MIHTIDIGHLTLFYTLDKFVPPEVHLMKVVCGETDITGDLKEMIGGGKAAMQWEIWIEGVILEKHGAEREEQIQTP